MSAGRWASRCSTSSVCGPTKASLFCRLIPGRSAAGTTDFGPLTLRTRAPVLIPRPETAYVAQLLTEHVLKAGQKPHDAGETLDVVDLCTGSGCIALLLARLLGTRLRRMRGYDISREAIALAKENAEDNAMHGLVEIAYGDVFDAGLVREIGVVDVLVGNPPYVPFDEWERLPRSVKAYEDRRALLGDPDGRAGRGLAFYRRIAEMIPSVLKPRGVVALEVGLGQAEEVAGILKELGGMGRTELWTDQYGRDRMVAGWHARPDGS